MNRKRMAAAVIILSLLLLSASARVYVLSAVSPTLRTATAHGSYSIKLDSLRGQIYDTKKRPLLNQKTDYYAAVSPRKNPVAQLDALMPHVFDQTAVLTEMQQGKPFLVKVDSASVSADGITVVKIPERYADDSLAPNLIGYTDSTGSGVSGLEKAYNNVLRGGTLTAGFAVDALGRTLQGLECTIRQTGNSGGGVQLTIDKDIQQFAQKAAQKYLVSGAAVVMDAQSGDILASASVPTFSQNDLKGALSADNSPMLNRAFSAYDLGSVFKIALAAEALETGISPSFTVNCTGKTVVAGKTFRCMDENGHGVQTMAQAISNSCNIYFITLGQQLGGDKILNMAQKLCFGQKTEFAPGFSSSAGVLPTEESLKIPAALANFSFGQGDFMATPIQVARMMCAVANGGMLPSARLVKAITDSGGNIKTQNNSPAPARVFSEATAEQLRQFLIQTVDMGTGMPARPKTGGAGGKTSTAQTGWKKDGKIINQAWFAGFYPAQNPKYVVVVIAENGITGGSSAGPVFKSIADNLAPYCGLSNAGK